MAQQEQERRSTLCQLLARNRNEFDIEYGGYLSNHMSHYLVALYELGASKERLEKAYEDYSTDTKLEPARPPTTTITTDTWRDYRGKKSHHLDLVAFFSRELEQLGVRTTLRRYVPDLLEGVCGSAFHGVIQLGYALEVMDVPNIAEGLAYFTYSFYSLGHPKTTASVTGDEAASATLSPSDVMALLDRVRQDARFGEVFTGDNKKLGFQKRLHLLAAQYQDGIAPYDLDFRPLIVGRRDDDASSTRRSRIEALIDLFTLSALKVFASSGYQYFFVLHLVTAFRALKVTLAALCGLSQVEEEDVSDDDAELVASAFGYFWRSVVCSYIAVDRPAVSDVTPDAIKHDEDEAKKEKENATSERRKAMSSWADVVAEVMPSHDEHLVKLVFVCWKEAHEHHRGTEQNGWGDYFLHAAINTALRFHDTWHY